MTATHYNTESDRQILQPIAISVPVGAKITADAPAKACRMRALQALALRAIRPLRFLVSATHFANQFGREPCISSVKKKSMPSHEASIPRHYFATASATNASDSKRATPPTWA